MQVDYNRQLNKKVVFFGFITYLDLFTTCIGLCFFIGTKSWSLMPFGIFVFIAYGIRFRIGRPEGYGYHYFRALLTPRRFRSGHIDPPYPINYTGTPLGGGKNKGKK
jgi:hypothetical protein